MEREEGGGEGEGRWRGRRGKWRDARKRDTDNSKLWKDCSCPSTSPSHCTEPPKRPKPLKGYFTSSNAYILVYVRASDGDTTPDPIAVAPPDSMRQRVEGENTILQAEVEGMMRDSRLMQEGEERQRKDLSQLYGSLPVKPGMEREEEGIEGWGGPSYSVFTTPFEHEEPCRIFLLSVLLLEHAILLL